MLQKIKLTNFQQHRSLSIDFGAGISAIRGANEAGKSTLIRAICYALFGAKALPMSLSEAVTWGEPESSLKVELEFRADSVVYSIKRGKSGAEINYDGGIVTGQNECTAFVSKLLKADAGSAARLMLANQNEIRGALEKGPAETTKLIEQLAEFSQLDELIELMQEQLTLGSPATAEAAISSAQAQLDQARAEAIPVNVAELDQAITAAQQKLQVAERQAVDADQAVDTRQQALANLQAQDTRRATAQQAVASADARLRRAESAVQEAQAVPAPAAFDVDGARDRISALANVGTLRAARLECGPHLGEPARAQEDRFEGDVGALEAEIGSAQATLDGLRKAVAACQQSIGTLQAGAQIARSKISTGNCSSCGQPVDHLPEVAARNAKFTLEADHHDERIGELQVTMATHQRNEVTAAGYLRELQAIRDEAKPRRRLLDRFASYLKADNLQPPTLEWTGGEVPADASAEIARLKQGITRFESEQRAHDAALAGLERAKVEVAAAREELAASQLALDEAPAAGDAATEQARDALAAARSARSSLQTAAREAQRAADDAVRAKQTAIEAYERALRTAEQAERILGARRKELKELAFNNGLMKAVRAARPVIADRLWNLVLAAVSKYFSEMRGSKSRVTKDTDGFKVDGHTASTLSGSTLDILGLAIRVALTRTFLPTAPFLVLDEPAAAMDGNRTTLMLGFLSSCGFDQCLLVSHEDISDSVADNIITI
jgi:DNA repair exonuclease SbcCD ATPase subunit